MSQRSITSFFKPANTDTLPTVESPKPKNRKPAATQKTESVQLQHASFDSSHPLSLLATCWDRLSKDNSRLAKLELLKNLCYTLIKDKSKEDLVCSILLTDCSLGPAWEGVKLGLGEALISNAIKSASASSKETINASMKQLGDYGLVAEKVMKGFNPIQPLKPLTIQSTFLKLREIALSSGNKSQDNKISLVRSLLTASKGPETCFIVRMLLSKMRIGCSTNNILAGLVRAGMQAELYGTAENLNEEDSILYNTLFDDEAKVSLKAADLIMRKAYATCPDLRVICESFIEGGFGALLRMKVHVGVPVKPMLADPAKSYAAIVERFEENPFTAEYKYDGERAQIHFRREKDAPFIKIYSRHQEDLSEKYPDIVSFITQAINEDIQSIVIDTECCAINRNTGRLQAFQILSHRSKKNVQEDEIEINVCLFAFDCLSCNGESLLSRPLSERRDILKSSVTEVKHHIEFATSRDFTCEDMDDLQAFFDESKADNTEGLMLKRLDSIYENEAARSFFWRKLKKDYLGSFGDTLDVIPIGASYGRGKRHGWYGAFTLACIGPDSCGYQLLGNIGTGFSDEILAELFNRLKLSERKTPPEDLDGVDKLTPNFMPDIWFDPSEVWEVKGADLTLSPVFSAARQYTESGKGISLRFPRLLRVRDDKGVQDATTAEDVLRFYNAQAVLQDDDEEDMLI